MSKKIITWQNPATIEHLTKSLKHDNVSITSTDTTLGFLAPLTQTAFDKLNALKGGRQQKPYLILVASPETIKTLVDPTNLTPQIQKILEQYWPGPLTVVFCANKSVSTFLTSTDNTIAIRCPQHDGLLSVLKNFDGLFSTSANKSGEPVAQEVDELNHELVANIDYIVVDDGMSEYTSPPSTIIDVSIPEKTRIVRQGVLKLPLFYA